MYRTFEEQLTLGKKGEALVKAALAARGHIILDVSNMPEWQQKDIDFVISKNGVSITLEIKNDIRSNQTGNVFVEIYNRNNRSRGGDGWLCYCEADYLCFV